MTNITINNKNSYIDYGITIESVSIQPPSKKKIKDSVIGMNGSYDFSTIATNGEITYNEREIKVKFNLITNNKAKLYIKYGEILEWLMDIGKSQLVFDFMPDYYFIAEVEEAPSFEEVLQKAGRLEVIFVAEPFRTGINLEGSDIWDIFNFETDVVQDTGFDIVGTKTINIINVGRLVCPTINVTTAMSLIFNSKTYNLVVGNNKFYGLKLLNGDNNMVVNGTGHISFVFRKVVL